ncbi:hypothetical protein [Mycolicibacterium sp. F2034L]|uniref:hypothetical protein n=1 Tax=Mycolicibacterium sp. F2034L TaxID=2926422 RepID=UPI001FF6E28E|nr:hypothetical protein [Mycolicibacterium sp. F2034L]MCK0175064.1 hypothetical protein [Mycolicibacterium sp. F2034L]
MATSKKSGPAGGLRGHEPSLRHRVKISAASAGMGAALIGWSLVGSAAGVAAADSGVESSSTGPAATPGVTSGSAAGSRAGGGARDDAQADGPSTTSRTPNRTIDADPPKRVVSRSNQTTAESSDSNTSAAPGISTERVETLQDPGIQFLGGGGAGPLPVVVAGRSDPLGAAGKFLGSVLKEALKSKTIANPVKELDALTPKHKSLIELIADAIKNAPPPGPRIDPALLKPPMAIIVGVPTTGPGISPFR